MSVCEERTVYIIYLTRQENTHVYWRQKDKRSYKGNVYSYCIFTYSAYMTFSNIFYNTFEIMEAKNAKKITFGVSS